MVEDAVEDARHNAALNKISNVEYHVGKVEDVVLHASTIDGWRAGDEAGQKLEQVVAVLDPPRDG